MSVELSTTRFDAVVFDMDGVITDTAGAHEAAWKRTFDEFLRARPQPFLPFVHDDYLAHVDGRPRDDGVADFLTSRAIALPYGTPDDPPDADTVWGLANRKNHDFLRVIAAVGAQPFPESVDLVRALQAHGFGTAVISASRNAAQILAAAGIGDLFPVRVDGVELERLALAGKPAPDVFIEAARRLDSVPARAVVVEDAIAGVEAGRAGGFGLVIGIDRTGDGDALRTHGADVVVRDLGAVEVRGC
jgi:alpha,alpha-trehalase